MTVVLVAIVPAFGAVQFLVSRYRAERESLALEWSRRGQADLPTEPARAVTDFSTALSYGPDRDDDRFLLAKALVASHRSTEAKAELEALAAADPADSEVNLELARIAAAGGEVDMAVRYYHAAIDGVWRSTAVVARRHARTELARLLMAHGQAVRAQAELIVLIDELPEDPSVLTDIGGMLAEAGATTRGLGLVRRALAVDPSDARAAQLAGELEFRSGDIRAATRDLRQAAASGVLADEARQMLEVGERAMALDPYADRLNVRTRAQRALRALTVSRERLDRCRTFWMSDDRIAPTLAGLDVRAAAAAKRDVTALERDADLIDDTIMTAFEIEKVPSGSCGPGSIDDRALAVIASQHNTQPQ